MNIFDYVEQKQQAQQYPEQMQQIQENEPGYNPNEFIEEAPQSPQQPSMFPQQEDQYSPKNLLRGAGRTAIRAGEQLIATPHTLIDLPQRAAIWGAEKITGKEQPELRARAKAANKWPSSQEIREEGKKLTGGIFEPENEKEEQQDEMVEDLTNLLNPIGGNKAKAGGWLLRTFGRGTAHALKSLGTLGIAYGVKEGASSLGASKETQNNLKNGTLFATSLFDWRASEKAARRQYNLRDRSYAPGSRTSAGNLVPELQDVIRRAESGGLVPESREAIAFINSIIHNVEDGTIGYRQLTDASTKINQFRRKYYPRNDPHQFLFDETSRAVNRRINHIARENPEFVQHHRIGNEIHGANARAGQFRHFLSTDVWKYMKDHPAVGVVGLAASPAGLALSKGGEFAARIWQSPRLANLYAGVIAAGATQNAKTTAEAIKKLNDAMIKDQKSNEEIDLSKYNQ